MPTATGSFAIKSSPLDLADTEKAIGHGRMLFEKTFAGDLVGSSVVSMLGIMNMQLGSGGYVAIEKITATLAGKRGTFLLQHSSQMNRGQPTQSITVVPDSATDDLAGLSGSMTIDIREKQHLYTFEYELS
jgi:hypothetical protein